VTRQLKSEMVATDRGLVVVRVEDAVDPVLAGRAGITYESPPQPQAQAMELVQLLVGGAGEPKNGRERWVVAVAGGRRVITLIGETYQLKSNSATIGA
jgi:hypothetical protein